MSARRHLFRALFAATLVLASSGGTAQDFPTKPVRLVVPFPAGILDTVARLLAKELEDRWAQPVIVMNKPGAGGNIGAGDVAHAPADGTTFLVAGTSLIINVPLHGQVPVYSLMKDLVPVTLVAKLPFVVVVNPAVPARSLSDLIAYARANPGKVNFGSGGNGTVPHVSGELFKMKAKVDVVHVPLKGAAATVTELIAGRVDMTIDTATPYLPFIASGQLRALAVPSAQRLINLPGVPTTKEARAGRFRDWRMGIAVGARRYSAVDHRSGESRCREHHGRVRHARGMVEARNRSGRKQPAGVRRVRHRRAPEVDRGGPCVRRESGLTATAGSMSDDARQRWDVEADVVVVGGGACGLMTTAIAAAAAPNAQVVLIEKCSRWGCNAEIAGGTLQAAATRLQRAAGIQDSPEIMAGDIMRKSGNKSDPAVTLALCRKSADLVHWFIDDLGVPLELATEIRRIGHTRPRMHAHPQRSGAPLVDALRRRVESLDNVSYADDTPGRGLITDAQGGVIGVLAGPDGQVQRIGCRRAVLATDGFGANREMIARYIPRMQDVLYVGAPGNTGDGIRWGMEIGAAVENLAGFQGLGYVVPGYGTRINPGVVISGGIMVNRLAHRFEREDQGYLGVVRRRVGTARRHRRRDLGRAHPARICARPYDDGIAPGRRDQACHGRRAARSQFQARCRDAARYDRRVQPRSRITPRRPRAHLARAAARAAVLRSLCHGIACPHAGGLEDRRAWPRAAARWRPYSQPLRRRWHGRGLVGRHAGRLPVRQWPADGIRARHDHR